MVKQAMSLQQIMAWTTAVSYIITRTDIIRIDHWPCNLGGHGDGHPDCTRTPIIAWGAGVQKPNTVEPTGHDDFSAEWDLNSYQRNDIKQADIAPLMVSRWIWDHDTGCYYQHFFRHLWLV